MLAKVMLSQGKYTRCQVKIKMSPPFDTVTNRFV